MSKRQGPRVVDLEVEQLSAEGFGVATFERRPVHIKAALPGDIVSARVVRRRRGNWYALPEAWIVRVGAHAKPACEAFMRCGGCSMQHLGSDDQLALKQRWLVEQLDAVGVTATSIAPPVRGPQYFYRRRARLAVRSVRDTGELLVGFRESFGSRVARLRSCAVLVPPFSDALPEIAATIGAMHARESIPQLEIAVGERAAAMIVRHVIALDDFDRELLARLQRRIGVDVQLQSGNYASIVDLAGAKPRTLDYRLDRFGVTLEFDAADFVQVNAQVNADLVATAIGWLGVEGNDRVVDLFCGLGNFTLPLAALGADVVGVEGAEELVRRGRSNAALNGFAARARFDVADLYATSAARDMAALFDGVDKVLLDPPRTGAGAVLAPLAASRVERIAYVSCHPVSFARDALALRKAGFTLAKVRVFDMFPHTAHVETLGLFERAWSR
ncbi:MAG TPA: 23S rRNA (uracil(1939)-C(5))-methyltransferase RlmD [Pseudomonadales bacterium]|nr:23S rRNA (uracil(1939)-C(5))-methyltransferase RlmD [Pseudomonadales bacterium]